MAFLEAYRVLKPGGYLMFSVSTMKVNAKSKWKSKDTNPSNRPKTGSDNRLTFAQYVEEALLTTSFTSFLIQESHPYRDSPPMSIAILKK